MLELLYESGGRISRIEIINLKKYNPLDNEIMLRVNELQAAVNQGSILKLKRIISKIIADVQKKEARIFASLLEIYYSCIYSPCSSASVLVGASHTSVGPKY